MYQLIREKISQLSDENWDLRELDNYVRILLENITVKSEESLGRVDEYKEAIHLFIEYLAQTPVYTFQYFNQSKQRILRILDGLILTLIERLEIPKNELWENNFNYEGGLYLAMYEQDHIGFFQQHPPKELSYYPHRRIKDDCGFIGANVFFAPHSVLTESMKEEIKERLIYLHSQFQ